MTGMNRAAGTRLDGVEHIAQSIANILTTPLGSRLMRREYGSLLPELIDQPQNKATAVRLYAATASALMRWEPRMRISKLSLQSVGPRMELGIDGEVGGEPVNLRVPLLMGGTS